MSLSDQGQLSSFCIANEEVFLVPQQDIYPQLVECFYKHFRHDPNGYCMFCTPAPYGWSFVAFFLPFHTSHIPGYHKKVSLCILHISIDKFLIPRSSWFLPEFCRLNTLLTFDVHSLKAIHPSCQLLLLTSPQGRYLAFGKLLLF